MFLATVDPKSLAALFFLILLFEFFLVTQAQPALSPLSKAQHAIFRFFSDQSDLLRALGQPSSVSSHRLLSPQITFLDGLFLTRRSSPEVCNFFMVWV